jgi:predicted O-methyltransferase YrrM
MSIELLDQLINSNDIGVEYGSGRSTFWFAKRCKHLTSFENNKKWFTIVSSKIATLKNVTYELLELNEDPIAAAYYKSIFNFNNESLDFIVIDGKYRDLIAIEAIEKLKKGGILIFDNAERYFPNKYNVPESIGNNSDKVPVQIKQLVKTTENWRKIWTTNGVTTTLLMFKK